MRSEIVLLFTISVFQISDQGLDTCNANILITDKDHGDKDSICTEGAGGHEIIRSGEGGVRANCMWTRVRTKVNFMINHYLRECVPAHSFRMSNAVYVIR